jgi:hypothetical protein
MGTKMLAPSNIRPILYAAIWGGAFIAYEIVDPGFQLYVDLAIIFGAMPIAAGLFAWIAVWHTAAGTGIPIYRGDSNGYTIRLRENVDNWRDVNRIDGLLMLNSSSVGKMDKASLVAGAPILTGVPEAELQSLVAQFVERGIAVNVDRDSSPN